MENIFISKIKVDKVRSLQNLEIQLSNSERKHLILTGKNGSGKTSLLEALRANIYLMTKQAVSAKYGIKSAIDHFPKLYNNTPENPFIDIHFNSSKFSVDQIVFAYIPAKRQLKLDVPTSIEKIELSGQTVITDDLSGRFLKYILYLNYQLLFAQSNGDMQKEKVLKKWFDDFQESLAEIYNNKELKLRHNAKNLTFQIEIPGYELFGFNEMADGYSAFLNIVIELLMRMDNGEGLIEYEKSGIVFVDEIETHLHVELQKRVLPFLTKLFPNIQFIVSTHSPFVISSLENAVVFDLEKKESLENPQRYSYETIIESYLDTDMYSLQIKEQLETYKLLYAKKRTPEENNKFLRAKTELELVPPASRELYLEFRQLEEKRKGNKK